VIFELALAACFILLLQAGAPQVPTFGTTVVISSGLRGQIYKIRHWTSRLPDFKKKKNPIGTIYTTALNIPLQSFDKGFPGVTRRFEWFAIDYTGKFWISAPGSYQFKLTSDDGSRLYIDENLLIDNDGMHPPRTESGTLDLSAGVHQIRIDYFQGPRYEVALVLEIAVPGQAQFRIFNTDDFKPPPDADVWKVK
jgi:hypothetical protein